MNVRELALVSALQAVLDVADGEEHPKLVSIAAFARRTLEGPGGVDEPSRPSADRAPDMEAKKASKGTLRWRAWQEKLRGEQGGEHVYLIARASDGLLKIGRSENVAARVKQLRGNVGEVTVVATAPGGAELETALHRRFAAQRRHGEWFEVGHDMAESALAELARPTPQSVGLPPVGLGGPTGGANASGSLFSSLSPLGSNEKASKNTRETEASEKENQGVQNKTAGGGGAVGSVGPTQPTHGRPTGDHQRVLAAFAEEYELCRKTKPVIDGKQAAAAKRLLAGRTADEAVGIVRRAFTDPFVAGKKPDLAYIASNINAYQGVEPDGASGVQRIARPAPEDPPPYTPQPQVDALVKAAIADMDAVGKDKTNGRR